MIGHKQIIACRKRGLKPSLICIEYGKELPMIRWEFDDPEKAIQNGLDPVVYIPSGEVPDTSFVTSCAVLFQCDAFDSFSVEILKRITQHKPASLSVITNDKCAKWKEGKWVTYW